MKTRNFSIREDQIKTLKMHYERSGVRMSEAVRKGIDLYIKSLSAKKEKKEKDEKTTGN